MRYYFNSSVLIALAAIFELSCIGEVGPQGPIGPPGSTQIDCPEGYVRDTSSAPIVLCRRGKDEIVKVGTGRSAFWMDRFEAGVWSGPDGTGESYGRNSPNEYPTSFPHDGQWTTRLYAASVVDVLPSRYLSWHQASEACAASGKRLPTMEQWFLAGHGAAANKAGCITGLNPMERPRMTSLRSSCTSSWGVQDQIGNLAEFTAEWHITVGQYSGSPSLWPDLVSYGRQAIFNVTSKVIAHSGAVTDNLPAIAAVGGDYATLSTEAGVWTLDARYSPVAIPAAVGFRCVTPL